MLPDAPPYMKWDEEVARQLTDFNKRLQHLERLERPAGGYTEGARVFNDANILAGNNVWTTLTFNSERWDTDAIHSIFLNTSRLTCQTAGVYVITGNVIWQNSAVDSPRSHRIRLNGAINIGYFSNPKQPNAGDGLSYEVTTQYDLIVGDFVEFGVYHNTGGAININAALNYSPEFMMQRIG